MARFSDNPHLQTLEAAQQILAAMSNGAPQLVLTEDSVHRFYAEVRGVVAGNMDARRGSFAIQLAAESPEHGLLHEPPLSWIATTIDFVDDPDNAMRNLRPTAAPGGQLVLYGLNDKSLQEMDGYADIPVISFGWSDVRDDYRPSLYW